MDLSPDELTYLIRQQQEKECENYKQRENRQRCEQTEMMKDLLSLQGEQTETVENINKYLRTIVKQTDELGKILLRPESESSQLPVTHKQREAAINVLVNMIKFVKNYSGIKECIAPENDIDGTKLCDGIKTAGESVNRELARSKTCVNQLAKLVENAELMKHCLIPRDDDQDVMG